MLVITELEVDPSRSLRDTGGIDLTERLYCITNKVSMKQWLEPESMRAIMQVLELEINGEVSRIRSELGSERADALIGLLTMLHT